jgi:hypothetical protein
MTPNVGCAQHDGTEQDPDVVSVQVAAKLVGAGTKWIYRAINDGWLPAVQGAARGPRLRIALTSLSNIGANISPDAVAKARAEWAAEIIERNKRSAASRSASYKRKAKRQSAERAVRRARKAAARSRMTGGPGDAVPSSHTVTA